MSEDSAAESLRSTPNRLLLRKNAIESFLQYDKMVKQKELIAVDTQLLNKKQEFTSRMTEISKKKVASKQKWDEMKERFESFVPYIDDDRAKKYETLQKYKLELLELNKKELELQQLKMELQEAIERNNALQNKVKKYQVYADFLTTVGEKHLNWREIDATSSPCKAVIKRHQTLINTRDDILHNISTATDELNKCQKDIEALQYSQEEQNLREKASRLKRKLDHLISRNAVIQDEFLQKKQAYCSKISQLNAILRAIDNLTWLCCKQQAIKREIPDNIDAKLRIIQHGIISKQDVINSIKHGTQI